LVHAAEQYFFGDVVKCGVLAVADSLFVQGHHNATCMLAHHAYGHSNAVTGNTTRTSTPAGEASGLAGAVRVMVLGHCIRSSEKLHHHSSLQK
jgi:hypothetical protein